MEISMSVTNPSCYNLVDIPAWTEASVLQVLQMPRVQNSSPKLQHPDNIFKGSKYLPLGNWPLNRFVCMDSLRGVHTLHVQRTWTFWTAVEAGPMPALCILPHRGEGKRGLKISLLLSTQS